MDAGLIILGILILFGATILFKAAGFTGGEEEKSSALEKASGRPSPAPKPEEPQQPSPKSRETREKITLEPGYARDTRICRNCMAENQPDAEFCVKCGKNLTIERDPEIFQKKRNWFKQHGWIKNPFSLDVIPALFTGYKGEVDKVMRTISMQSGHILITGEIGTGKTTMLRWLELGLPSEYKPIYVFRPPEHFDDLIGLIVRNLDGAAEGRYNIYNIEKAIKKVNKRLVLLLDEAHEFKPEITNPLKTLGDVEGINLVMAALPEAEDDWKNNSKALYDRIVAKVRINGLEETETNNMIGKRIENVGGFDHKPFTEKALKKVYELSMGHPRKVLKLCDYSVMNSINDGSEKIDIDHIIKAAESIT
ncbi:MAG: AAA family ATPase [Candidatus Altiarchaeota archaeon]